MWFVTELQGLHTWDCLYTTTWLETKESVEHFLYTCSHWTNNKGVETPVHLEPAVSKIIYQKVIPIWCLWILMIPKEHKMRVVINFVPNSESCCCHRPIGQKEKWIDITLYDSEIWYITNMFHTFVIWQILSIIPCRCNQRQIIWSIMHVDIKYSH